MPVNVTAWFVKDYFTALVADGSNLATWYAADAHVTCVIGGETKTSSGSSHLPTLEKFFKNATVAVNDFSVKSTSGMDALVINLTGMATSASYKTEFQQTVTLFNGNPDVFYIAQETFAILKSEEVVAAPIPAAKPVAEKKPKAAAPVKSEPAVLENAAASKPVVESEKEEVVAEKVATEKPAGKKAKQEKTAPKKEVVPAAKEDVIASKGEKATPEQVAGPKSWLNRVMTGPSTTKPAHQPVTVVASLNPKEDPKVTKEERSPKPERVARKKVECKVFFNVPVAETPATEEEIRSCLGDLASDIVEIRYLTDRKIVFIDFADADALDKLQKNPPTLGGKKIVARLQNDKRK